MKTNRIATLQRLDINVDFSDGYYHIKTIAGEVISISVEAMNDLILDVNCLNVVKDTSNNTYKSQYFKPFEGEVSSIPELEQYVKQQIKQAI